MALRYEFDAGLHYTVPESAQLLQLCTGGTEPPVPCPLLGETTTNVVSGHSGLTYDRLLVGTEPPFDVQLHQVRLLYRRTLLCTTLSRARHSVCES